VKRRILCVLQDQLRGNLVNRCAVRRTTGWPWCGATRSTPLSTDALSGAL
jgi:hypothetical protein